jgi:hypothetical protein
MFPERNGSFAICADAVKEFFVGKGVFPKIIQKA